MKISNSGIEFKLMADIINEKNLLEFSFWFQHEQEQGQIHGAH